MLKFACPNFCDHGSSASSSICKGGISGIGWFVVFARDLCCRNDAIEGFADSVTVEGRSGKEADGNAGEPSGVVDDSGRGDATEGDCSGD